MKRPKAFDLRQHKPLPIIIAGLIVMVLFPLLHALLPQVAIITRISSKLEPSLFFIVLLLLSLLPSLGDEKAALKFVPCTVPRISRTDMLVAVASKAEVIDILSSWLGRNMSLLATKSVVGLISGAMSFISSTLGVVAPTLIPVMPGISAETGVSSTTLVSAIMGSGHFADVPPFSTDGAMVLAGEKAEEKRTSCSSSL